MITIFYRLNEIRDEVTVPRTEYIFEMKRLARLGAVIVGVVVE